MWWEISSIIFFCILYGFVLRIYICRPPILPKGTEWPPLFEGGAPAFNLGYTVKKRLAVFPSAAGTSLIKLSLAGKNLILTVQGEFGK